MAKKPGKRSSSRSQLASSLDMLIPSNKIEEEIEKDPENAVQKFTTSVAMIPLDIIEVNPHQPRVDFDAEALQELADSITTYGLIQPITVRRLSPKQYQLISGERRMRASKMAGLEEVPAYIRMADDQAMLEMALVENIQRENLNAIEIAQTYHRLKEECSLTDEGLADRVGKKRSTITNHLRLLKLPPDIQKAIKERQISMGHARALAGVYDVAVRNSFFQETLNKGLSVRALEKLINDFAQEGKKKREDKNKNTALPDDYRKVEQSFRSFFGTGKLQVKLRENGKGQIVIPFNSVDELNAFIERIED